MSRQRKSGGGGHDAAGGLRWLLTYADMITLLVVFFLILYSFSRSDTDRFAMIAASLSRAFNVGVLAGQEFTTVTGQQGQAGQIRVDDLRFIVQDIGKYSQIQGLAENVNVGLTKDGILISISGNLLFPPGTATIQASGHPLLDEVVKTIQPLPNTVLVEGHTDDIPFGTPEFPSNWELSAARALSVVRYLSAAGISEDRFAVAAYGPYRPVADNGTREGRERNRRVDLLVIQQGLVDRAAPASQVVPIGEGAAGVAPAPSGAPSGIGAAAGP